MIQALYNGKRVRHQYFGGDEYMFMYKDEIFTEDGYNMGSINDEFMEIRKGGFWEDGWEVIEEEEAPQATFTMFDKPYFYIALAICGVFFWILFKTIF